MVIVANKDRLCRFGFNALDYKDGRWKVNASKGLEKAANI